MRKSHLNLLLNVGFFHLSPKVGVDKLHPVPFSDNCGGILLRIYEPPVVLDNEVHIVLIKMLDELGEIALCRHLFSESIDGNDHDVSLSHHCFPKPNLAQITVQ
jgi:hypothetical protein